MKINISKSSYVLFPPTLCNHSDPIKIESSNSLNGTPEWTKPMEFDINISKAWKKIRQVCKIAFVKGSKVAADDDQYHLRSALSILFGLVRRRNPKKGFGAVAHGFVSILSRMFLGGHICSSDETTLDAFRQVFKEWCSDDESEDINLLMTTIVSDREYQSENFMAFMHSVNARTIGTHISRGFFPFASSSSNQKRKENENVQVIEEVGASYCCWKERKVTVDGKSATCYVVGYRSGLGNVTFMHSTAENCGPGNYSLTVEDRGKRVTEIPQMREGTSLHNAIHNNLKILTYSQGSDDWYIARRFKFTGTIAYSAIKEYIRRLVNDESNTPFVPDLLTSREYQAMLKPIMDMLALEPGEYRDSNTLIEMRNKIYTEDELRRKNVATLVGNK